MSNYTDGYNEGYDTALTLNAAELARLREENRALVKALLPFASVLGGNYSSQPDTLPIRCGFHAGDCRFELTLGGFRNARAALAAVEEKDHGNLG